MPKVKAHGIASCAFLSVPRHVKETKMSKSTKLYGDRFVTTTMQRKIDRDWRAFIRDCKRATRR